MADFSVFEGHFSKDRDEDGLADSLTVDTNGMAETHLSSTMGEAFKVNPDSQAKIRKLAKESGLPEKVVETDPSDIEHTVKLKNLDSRKVVEESPATSKFMNDYNNASIAHDDLETLMALEKKLRKAEPVNPDNSFLGNAARGSASRVTNLLGSLYGFASQAGDALEEKLPVGGFVFEDSMVPRYAGAEEWKRLKGEGMDDLVGETGKILKETDFGYSPDATWETTKAAFAEEGFSAGALGETLAFGLETGAVSLADMAATVVAMPTYILARSQEIGEERAANKGKDDATIEETLEAMPFAVGSAVLERILPDKVLKGMGKNEVTDVGKKLLSRSAAKLKKAMASAGSGLITEASTEAVQEGLIEYVGEKYGTDAPMVLVEALDRAAGGAVGGGVMGGALAGVSESANIAVNTLNERKVQAAKDHASKMEHQADMEQTNIDGINDLATNSNLAGRDVEAFKQFIEDADGDNNTKLFLDGPEVRKYLEENQANIATDPALQLLAEQVSEAAALGGDLSIPVADFAATLAGTDHFTNLRNFMTLSEDTQSPHRKEQAMTETQSHIETLVDEAQKDASQYAEAQTVYRTVRDQLVATGTVSQKNAAAMARIAPAWATVYAKKHGIDVQTAFEQSGLNITSEVEAKSTVESTVNQPVKIDPAQIEERLSQGPTDRRQTETPVDVERRSGDRRSQDRRDKISKMTPEEQYAAIYQHELSGLPNRRAFEEDLEDAQVVVSVDVDSLKAANDNMGHDAGDALLKTVGEVIFAATDGAAYHISGDEFFVLGDNQQDIEAQLTDAQEQLKTSSISSDRGTFTGVGFTFGTGTDKKSADEQMEHNKEVREQQGLRVGRGELPPGMKLIAQAAANSDTLKQNKGTTRGYYEPANSAIRLTEAADLSTFLHEFAHFMYETEIDASAKNAESLTTVTSIQNWFKRNAESVAKEAGTKPEDVVAFIDKGTSGDASMDAALRTATHEQFARGFETYLMEGKAPSRELRSVFRTFARWMTEIYRSVKGDLQVNLDPEMREVFDRLLATEEQINAAESRAQYEPMFTEAAMAGMTEEEYAAYKRDQSKVKDKQTETLREKLIKEFTRQNKAWWKSEKADVILEETETLKGERVYRAREMLKKGHFKISRDIAKEMVGQNVEDKRGRKSRRVPAILNGMTATGDKGLHPDEVAAAAGYSSGAEMLHDLVDAPTLKAKADANAEAVMLERHGDIMHDGTIEAQADAAVQNEARGELILKELKALRKKAPKTPILDRNTIKEMAEANIAKLSFKDLHPGKYRKAELQASRESQVALAKGDHAGAARAKTRQVLNYYLGMAATNARTETTKIVDRMSRYNKKAVQIEIMKAEGGHWEQLVKILNRFEFRKSATLKSVDEKNQALNVWVKERVENEGEALTLSAMILDEGFQTHWKNVPFGELQGVSDSVKNIEHVARYSNKVTRAGEEMDFKKLVSRWTDSINANGKDRFTAQRTDTVRGRKTGRWVMAQMTKIPFMASWLDGHERAGMSHEVLVQPFTDAYNEEVKLWKDVGQTVMDSIEGRSKEDIKRHKTTYFIPELKDGKNDGNLEGSQIIAVALNVGNQGNLKKMLLGEGWANPKDETTISMDNPKLKAVLSRMTKSDWELVQKIWDQMDLLYPQLAEVHKKTTGLAPPKVEASPVSTPFGEFKGGYYPVKYDAARSNKARKNEDALNAETESMFSSSSSIHASVSAGATNERTGYYAPMRLNLDVVPNHFQETIHFITHHDAVRQTNKLINNDSVADAITSKLGPEEFSQLKPWLNSIAKDGREAPTKMFWDAALSKLRFGVTLGAMGFKASTGIIQISGLSNSVAELGLAPVYKAMRSILGSRQDMKDAWDFAIENSKVMGHRAKTMDREIKNAMTKLEGKRGLLAVAQEASMKHIAYIQAYMVDLPTWHAAYIKEFESSGDQEKAFARADWTIENVQGSGATKDLPAIMRSQAETGRMLTMFMTFFSSLWNMERDLVKGAKGGAYSVSTVAAKAAFLFTLPVLFEMFMRGEFGGDDEDPEELLQKTLMKTALYPVASVPFVRDIAAGALGEFGYNYSPIAGTIAQGVQGAQSVYKGALTDSEISMGAAKSSSKLVGAALGIPGTGQIWASGEHLYDVIAEGEEFTTHQLLFGPERD